MKTKSWNARVLSHYTKKNPLRLSKNTHLPTSLLRLLHQWRPQRGQQFRQQKLFHNTRRHPLKYRSETMNLKLQLQKFKPNLPESQVKGEICSSEVWPQTIKRYGMMNFSKLWENFTPTTKRSTWAPPNVWSRRRTLRGNTKKFCLSSCKTTKTINCTTLPVLRNPTWLNPKTVSWTTTWPTRIP